MQAHQAEYDTAMEPLTGCGATALAREMGVFDLQQVAAVVAFVACIGLAQKQSVGVHQSRRP